MRALRCFLFLLSWLFCSSSSPAGDVRQPTSPNWPQKYAVTGSVSVSNFPASQPVTGTVSLSPLPLRRFKLMNVTATPVQACASPCDLWAFYLYNNASAGTERTVKMVDVSSAPIVGTTPADVAITVGGRSSVPMNLPGPTSFSNGLWIFATTGSGDGATGAPQTGDVSAVLFFR